MEGVNKDYLGRHKKFRLDSKKLATAFFVSAFIVAIVVFWWLKLVGITVTGEAFCGLSEHTHSEECYVQELICDYIQNTTAEIETTEEVDTTLENEPTVSGTLPSEEDTSTEETAEEETTEAEVSVEPHNHNDECYEKTLACIKIEHMHTVDCYPDFSADAETESDWLRTFEEVTITKSPSENLVNTAKTQLGYTESTLNFEFDEDGTKRGYTRYGEWYGNPYGNWNAMFVSFCLSYSNLQETESVISSGAETMHQQWQTAELFEATEGHEPKIGELIFLDSDEDKITDFVAIISGITEDSETDETEIKVIIGNLNNCVEEIVLDESFTVIGYGLTDKLKTVEEETTTETTTEEVTTEVTTTEAETTTVTESDDEENTEEPWALDWESEEFRDKAVKYVAYLINQIPDVDEFENKLNEYDSAEDYDGYEEYYKEVYDLVSKAYVNYENLLLDLRESVQNREHLFEYEWLYSGTTTMAVTETRTVEFVNYYDNATAYKTVLIHSNNVGSYSSFGFYWWYAVVVDENEYGELVVTNKYGYELTNKSSLKPTTDKGFVLLSHGDSNTFDCDVGDEVTVNFDYLNSSGKNSSGFGTVTFSDYVPPEPEVEPEIEVEEDLNLYENTAEPSDSQIDDGGGKTTSGDKKVITTKTIDGTSEENVFDITLTVQTQTDIQTFLSEPDMAVVIVMDISNTMNSIFTDDTMSRYDAAVVAASSFINQFAENTAGLSKIGFVAFNTSAHEIFDLQPCSTTAQATALISDMKTDTENIIDNYVSDDTTRFTNVEGGLKRAYDMLEASGNSNQYVILLTDGFPTTYLKDNSADSTNYEGYNPYTPSGTIGTDGVFYDYVTGYYCSYGTSYSDKASIKAREMATSIKNSGGKIFSIGVDVAGQTIAEYDGRTGLSVIDRTGTTYEIGGADDLNAYKNWLGNSVGSGYYYDSTDQEGITTAFNDIFAEIRKLNEQSTKTVWTATDPMPVYDEEPSVVGFIHFYDKDGNVVDAPDNPESLTGTHDENGENTAYHEGNVIHWDLKKSGYTTSVDADDSSVTYYYYKLKYRVRLVNEKDTATEPFTEGKTYPTNGDAYLEYRNIVTTDGVQQISDLKYVSFSKPAVHGYLSGFGFTKQNDLGVALPGAQFTLAHDDANCTECHGDGTALTDSEAQDDNYVNDHLVHEIGPYVAESDENGSVRFSNIPSGHIYTLTETVIPSGYMLSGSTYSVEVAYDVLTVTETLPDGTQQVWTGDNNVISNLMEVFLLPETGGTGTLPLTIIGFALMAFPLLYSTIRRKRERRLT